ncbi:MAG TPA: ABC transporter permease [Terriglobia bacterium]|nr:ABC transporter permease [Terriglobia bacterium]
MASLIQFASRFTALFRKRQLERELNDELRAHVEMATEENIRRGLSRDEARIAALREFGGMEQTKELYREQRGLVMLETFFQDVRYGVRMLRKNPGFAAVAIITLGLGIGVNTTIFSFVHGMLLRQPPVADPNRVMMLCGTNPKGGWMPEMTPVSAPDYLDWRRQANSYSGMAAATFDSFTLSGSEQPERVPGGEVSANYFQVMGVAPIRGRAFALGEDQPGHAKLAMIGEDLWRRHFGADPAAIGRTIKVNGEDYTVIGVVPSRFRMWIFPADLWTPLEFKPERLGPEGRKDHWFLNVFARLKPGVSRSQAQAELAGIASRLATDHPHSNKGLGANVVTLQKYMADTSNTRPAMNVLMGAVIFVLLIACANLANLLLARNTARTREFAIRAALGAGRFRLARQLLSECVLLSVAGGGLGLAISALSVRVLRTQLNWNENAFLIAREIYIDRSVLVFTLAASFLAAIVFGLAPALQISRSGPAAGLKEHSRTTSAGREHRRLQNLLVIGELALSLILLVGAGLFVRSFIDQLRAAPGFNAHNILTAALSLSGEAYKDPAHQSEFYKNVLRQLAGQPDVESAAATSDLPFEFPGSASFTVEGQPAAAPDEQPSAGHFMVSPRYFHTAQIPLLQGREFTATDDANSVPVAIVNEAFARKYFPNANPLGRHIKISRGQQTVPWSEIVGVVANVNEYSSQSAPRPDIFEPFLARPTNGMKLVVRTRGNPAAFTAALRQAVFAVDKDQALTSVRTMDRVIQDSGQGDNVMAELMGTFAGLALLMAAVGIYGLLAYLVGQRTNEFGIRMALGAPKSEILRLVIRNAMSLVVIGTGIGFLVSLALPPLFTASFNGFHVSSGLILMGAPVVVLLVALASCYIPARRATKVDPMVALRYE